MSNITTAGAVLTAILFFVTLALLAWVIYKRSLLEVQSRALDEYAKAVKGYETRVEQLEAAIASRDDTIKRMQRKLAELEAKGKEERRQVELLIEAIAGSNVCLGAEGCPNRTIPTV